MKTFFLNQFLYIPSDSSSAQWLGLRQNNNTHVKTNTVGTPIGNENCMTRTYFLFLDTLALGSPASKEIGLCLGFMSCPAKR